MAEYIVACCVIHNICILKKDELVIIPILATDSTQDHHINERQANSDNNEIHKRNMIMNMLQRECN